MKSVSVPKWFSARKHENGRCFWCQERIEGSMAAQTISYRCNTTEARVHWHVLLFHPQSGCVEKFHNHAKEVEWSSYYDVYPSSPNDSKVFILLQTIKNHKRTGRVCKACKRHEETHSKFKNDYCSKKCRKIKK